MQRFPGERRTLWLTLAAGLVAVLALTPLSMGTVVLLVFGGLAMRIFSIHRMMGQLRRLPSADQVPRVARIVEQCRSRLKITDEIDVRIQRRDQLNAFAIGMGEPFVVVVYTGLIQSMDDDELAFVIGHELGHVKYRHTRVLALVGQIGSQTMGTGLVELMLRRLIFLRWMRAGEFTADRAGLVACGDLHKALSTLLKLSMGRDHTRVDIDGLIAKYRDTDVSMLESMKAALSTHPAAHARMDELVDHFHSSGFAART